MIKNKALFLSLLLVLCIAIGSASAIDVSDIDNIDVANNEINILNAVDIQVEDTTTDIDDNESESIVVSDNSNTKNVESISTLSVSSANSGSAISSVSTGTVSASQILAGATYLKNYVETKHGLPDYVNIKVNESYLETEEFLYLMSVYIKNLGAGNNISSVSVRSVPDHNKDLNGDWVLSLTLTKTQYVDVATRVYNYIINNNAVPNYATLINGQQGNYKLYTYKFACILDYYKTEGALPIYSVFDSGIFETYSISNNLSNRAKYNLTFYITTDNIISPSTDLAALNKIKNALIALGYNAIVLGVGPNYHNIAYQYGCTGSNSVLLGCFGAVDVGCIEEWAGDLGTWFPTYYKGANVLSVFYLDPYGCAANLHDYIGRSWDANYGYPLNDSAKYMEDNGISYIQTGTVDAVINILRSIFTGPTQTNNNSNSAQNPAVPTTKYVTVSDIIKASVNVKAYVLKNYALPATIDVGSYTLTKAQFVPLMGYAIKLIDYGKSLSTKVQVISVKDTSYTSSISYTAKKASYVDMAYRVYNYCVSNKAVPNYASIDSKKADSRSFMYGFAKILAYYDTYNKLPTTCLFESSVFTKPKNTTPTPTPVVTTKKVSVSNIITAAVNVRAYVLKYHRLPATVTVGSYTVTKDQFAYLVSVGVVCVHYKKLSNKITIIDVKSSSYTSSISYTAKKSYYITAAYKVYKYCSANKVTPGYATVGSKKADVRSYMYAFSKVLAYYKTYGKLPTTCLFESKVFR